MLRVAWGWLDATVVLVLRDEGRVGYGLQAGYCVWHA